MVDLQLQARSLDLFPHDGDAAAVFLSIRQKKWSSPNRANGKFPAKPIDAIHLLYTLLQYMELRPMRSIDHAQNRIAQPPRMASLLLAVMLLALASRQSEITSSLALFETINYWMFGISFSWGPCGSPWCTVYYRNAWLATG